GGQTQSAVVTVNVTSPALWSTDSPSRYSLTTKLSVGGTVVDTTTTSFGIRYFSFDASTGFSLNGQPMKLQGVDLHATEGAIGSAVRYDALVQQKEMVHAAKNSPAVVLWSIGNETPDTGLPDGPPIAQQLIGYIKSIDTTRPVVMGSDRYRSLPRPA